MKKIITRQTANFFLTNCSKCDTIQLPKGKELIAMFVVKDYTNYGIDYYFCRTIEKAKEIFDRVFWEWVKDQTKGNWPDTPQDYDCETWEELLQECWEDGMNWEDVVSCRPIVFEEDN